MTAATLAPPTVVDGVDEVLCEHRGCASGEPSNPGPLVPGGPARPAWWGGAGPGPARTSGPACPAGLDYCCGLCCGGE
ncbi:hypothetical protein [Micromonospora sp. RP3T]|uniref:hypothetical protein n=1 Tax=Micromonospora sp. RP3T TaxID=2135446 RepID=UPI003D757529